MAIEITTGQKSGAFKVSEQAGTIDVQTPGVKTSELLSGQGVKVTDGSLSDLEKLVLKLKSETTATRMSVAERRMAVLSTVLDSMAERISEQERAALLEVEGLNLNIDDTKKDIAKWQSQITTAEANSLLLQTQIEALEDQIKLAVKDGEEHRKQVEKLKEQKAEEDAKIKDLKNAIASAKTKIEGWEGKIESLLGSIGAATMAEVSAAVKAAAGDATATSLERESEADRAKAEAKAIANNPANVIHDALMRLDDEIAKTLEEAQVVKA